MQDCNKPFFFRVEQGGGEGILTEQRRNSQNNVLHITLLCACLKLYVLIREMMIMQITVSENLSFFETLKLCTAVLQSGLVKEKNKARAVINLSFWGWNKK
jgi:hypothetical protein